MKLLLFFSLLLGSSRFMQAQNNFVSAGNTTLNAGYEVSQSFYTNDLFYLKIDRTQSVLAALIQNSKP
jgi:hypothetical protein